MARNGVVVGTVPLRDKRTDPGVGPRRQARQVALQALFQWEAAGNPPAAGVRWAEEEYGLDESVSTFAQELANGVLAHLPAIDDLITRYAHDWELLRLARVDRNILRIAIFELLFANRPDVPPPVAISEAVELAKRFSTVEAGRFVNGILGQLARDRGLVGAGLADPGETG